jgi:hypothetical protein
MNISSKYSFSFKRLWVRRTQQAAYIVVGGTQLQKNPKGEKNYNLIL